MWPDHHVAIGLRDNFLKKVRSGAPTVFLVGAQAQKDESLRARLRYELTSRPGTRDKVDVYYPEALFDDLLSGKHGQGYDLLGLENVLAMSVHAIVILLEGAGAIAELGAFCNHPELSKKLVVVVNRRHRRDRSFIMLGPIRQLRLADSNSVVYFDYEDANTDWLGREVRTRLRRLSGQSAVSENPDNPIVAKEFLLGAIYIGQPLHFDQAVELINFAAPSIQDDATVVVRMALSMLEADRLLSFTNGQYSITTQGTQALKNRIELSGDAATVWRDLDKYRVGYLNNVMRKRKLTVA